MSFGVCFGQFGAEVIGWVRSGYHNKGVGELGLAYAEQIAFARKISISWPCTLARRIKLVEESPKKQDSNLF